MQTWTAASRSRTIRGVVWLFALSLVLASCGSGQSGESVPGETVPGSTQAPPGTETPGTQPPVTASPGEPAEAIFLLSEQPRQAPLADPAQLESTVDADTAFAFDLFEALRDDENLMISPYSIAAALTMAYAGAAGTTAEQMADVLHLTRPADEVHNGRNLLESALGEQPFTGEDQPFSLEVANSVWGQAGFGFRPEYLDILATHYGAGLYTVDYLMDPEGARQAINDWVDDATAGRIEDLLPSGSVDEDTRLVLANAIWFKAAWLEPFDPRATVDGPFVLLGGEEVQVPMMHKSELTRAAQGDGYVAVELPYVGDASMIIVVPDAGMFETLAFDENEFHGMIADLESVDLTLAMPKFSYESDTSLAGPLSALGMQSAFLPAGPGGADFSALSQPPELSITDVLHKSFIAVDEEGTEAAAATGVVMGLTAVPQPLELTIDRPFLYLIRHTSSGELLFLGQVTDPR